MSKLDLNALRAKYLGDEPTINTRPNVTPENYFIENNPNGYGRSDQFLTDLSEVSGDPLCKKGMEEFFEVLSIGGSFGLSDLKQDSEGYNFHWISYYKGRIRRSLKIPLFDGLIPLLETTRGSDVNLTLEGLINKAIDNLRK